MASSTFRDDQTDDDHALAIHIALADLNEAARELYRAARYLDDHSRPLEARRLRRAYAEVAAVVRALGDRCAPGVWMREYQHAAREVAADE